MMLNLLRADELSVKEMMKRSFSEFARDLIVKPLSGKLRGLKEQLAEAEKVVLFLSSFVLDGELTCVDDKKRLFLTLVAFGLIWAPG